MRTRFTRFYKTVIALLLVGACNSDEVLSPGGPPSLSADFVPVGSVTLGIPNQDSPTATVALPNFTKRVLLRATITGTVDIALTPYNPGPGSPTVPGAPRTVGPQGYAYAANPPQCGARVQVGYGSFGGGTIYYVPCGTSDQSGDTITTAVGYLYSSVAGGSAVRSAGTGQQCYHVTVGWGPCFYYSTSGQTVTLDRITADFELTAAPQTVNYNDTVTVTASITPGQVGGLNVPWTMDSIKWLPGFGTQASPCGTGSFVPTTGDSPTRICRRPFTRSGTLTVFVTVNGDVKQQSVAITVTPPKLKVTASPAAIAGAQAVTFTATVTPSSLGQTLSGWTWRADSGPGGISPDVCYWNQNPCTRTISKSGWIKATKIVNGGEYTLVDSAHVSVVPCLTGDSLLDDSRIRKALNDAMNGSNPNGPAASRRERGGARIQLPSGGVLDTLLPVGLNDTPCSYTFPGNLGAAGVPVVIWHVHPFMPRDTTDPLPYDPNVSPHSACPQLANARPLGPGAYYTSKPGPSREDVVATVNWGVPHIIVDKAEVGVVQPNGSKKAYPRNQPGKCDALRL
jgi:hypothetical protein